VAGEKMGTMAETRWVLARFGAAGELQWIRDCCDGAAFSAVFHMAESPEGALWIADRFAGRVRRLDELGQDAAVVQLPNAATTAGPLVAVAGGGVLAFASGPSGAALWEVSYDGTPGEHIDLAGVSDVMSAVPDPAGAPDGLYAALGPGIQRFDGLALLGAGVPSDAMTDEFGVTSTGQFWRVYQDEPLVLLLAPDGTMPLKLMPEDLWAKLAAFNELHGTSWTSPADFNRLGVMADDSLLVPSHQEVLHLDTAGSLLHVFAPFTDVADVAPER